MLHPAAVNAASNPFLQVLQDSRASGQLLQPLQPTDVRIIKAEVPNPATVQPPPTTPLDEPPASATPVHHQHSANPADGPPADSMPQELLLDLRGDVSAAALPPALASGFTLVLRDMPKRCFALAQICEALEVQLGLPAGANLYLTPAGGCSTRCHARAQHASQLLSSG